MNLLSDNLRQRERGLARDLVGLSTSAQPDLDASSIEKIVLASAGPMAGSLHVRGPLAANRFSRIFRGDGGAFPCPVAIKLFLRDQFDEPPADSARAYCSALEALSVGSADDPIFGIVRPFGVIDGFALVVTEWIDGPTVAAKLLRSSPAQARLVARKAGTWLSRLQRQAGLVRRPMDAHAALTRLTTSIDGKPGGSVGAVARTAARLLRDTVDMVTAADTVLWSRSHGDFKPSNLIVRDGRLYGIDLDLRLAAPTVHDAAHFLNHLQLLFWAPRGIHRLAGTPELVDAFCQGYSVDGSMELPDLQLAWERLRNALHLSLRNHEWSRPPRSWIAGFALRHLVKELTADLASAMRRALASSPRAKAEPSHAQPAGAQQQTLDNLARIAYLEDVLIFMAEDDDTWFSPEADRMVFEALKSSARNKG